jgi:hypothetical protein
LFIRIPPALVLVLLSVSFAFQSPPRRRQVAEQRRRFHGGRAESSKQSVTDNKEISFNGLDSTRSQSKKIEFLIVKSFV